MPGRTQIGTQERELIEKAHKYMPGGSNGNLFNDVIIRKGQGSRVWDISNNEYVDYLMGSGPMLIGHGHPEVISAVVDQIENGTTFFAHTEPTIHLAEAIIDALPCAESVRFSSSGSEATLLAMRAIRAYRKRDKILKFEGGFHGMNDYSLMSLMPSSPYDFPKATPDSAGIPKSVQTEMLIAPFNNIETTSAIIEHHHNELAGVIIEPFQRVIAPKPGFLEGLREVTNQYDLPLIFDEIVTGFRFAYGGAQEYYGVTPDLCTLGKVVSGGFPLSAVAGKTEIMDHFNPTHVDPKDFLPQIGTLNGNPVAAVAGLATLRVLKRQGTYERLFDIGQRIKDGLEQLLHDAEIPAQVLGIPSLFDVSFGKTEIIDYRSTLEMNKQKMTKFNKLLLEEGIFKGDTKYYVSTSHDLEEVAITLKAFESAIAKLSD